MEDFIIKEYSFLTALRKYFSYSIFMLGMFILLRLYELGYVLLAANFPRESWLYILAGFQYDFLVFLKTSFFLLVPFLVFYYLKPKIAKYFYLTFVLLITIGTLSLVKYFTTTSIPLGSDLLAYSKEEIEHTVGASGQFSIWLFVPFILFIALIIVAFRKTEKIEPKRTFSFLFAIIVLIISLTNISANPNGRSFEKEFNEYLATNKLAFFVTRNYEYVENKMNESDNLKNIDIAQNMNADTTSFKYIDKNYPFLRTGEIPDVLGQFFNTDSVPPNFVFIITESLGSAYCGPNANIGSFVPFLDTLIQKSLFWENFLSTSGRTFAVMPSMFASTPFAEKGFADMGKNMPDHVSLVSLLKEHGYTSSFMYCGDATFDNMTMFFKQQLIDKVIDVQNFGSGYTKLPSNSGGFSWGYTDYELFRRYLNEIKNASTKPRLDILLTVAMHDPFLIPNQEYYKKRVNEHINKLKKGEDIKSFNRQYTQQLSAVMFYNDAIRYLITEYSKRPDYKNTIFIITGDHRMPEIPIATQIDRFRVPFIMYSPMLKQGKIFSSVSSHFDVTPTILSFLAKNYGLKFPKAFAWMGSGIDIESTFRNIHSYPLMRNKNELFDYVDKEYFLANNILYKLYPNLDIEAVEDAQKLKEIQMKFEAFKQINLYACKKNMLIPDSLKIKRK